MAMVDSIVHLLGGIADDPVLLHVLARAGYRTIFWPEPGGFSPSTGASAPQCLIASSNTAVSARWRMGCTMPLSVVVLVPQGAVVAAVAAMKAGASDCVEWPGASSSLIAAIDHALAARPPHDASATFLPVERMMALTSRERQVLRGLAQGLSNKVMARDLAISPRTVEVHRARLMTKLGVDSLSGALRIAFAAGLQHSDADRSDPRDVEP